MSTSNASYDTVKPDSSSESRNVANQTRKPLICFICDDFYHNPCLLSCFHTFCYRCIECRINNGQIICPICGSQTLCKGSQLSSDLLIHKLIDILNAENPPCSNCDKRNRSSMFFCSTCGQALCNQCRENIHKAKMFSSHEIVPISKFSQDGLKKCIIHGEAYSMYSVSQNILICVNCFRDMPTDVRQQCLDIDTAYSQTGLKLESSIAALCEAQNTVRDGIVTCRTYLDELQQNTDNEKMAIHSFTQDLQEAINKTQSVVLLEVQRQYEMKERCFRNQLINLSSVLPVIQQHVTLCQNFANTLNKYQFLDVVFPMIDRLSVVSKLSQTMRPLMSSQIRTNYRTEFAQCLEPWIGKLLASSMQQSRESIYERAISNEQYGHGVTASSVSISALPSQKQHSVLKAKALEGDGPFSNHCRSFSSQVKEISSQIKNIRDRLLELRKDISVIQKPAPAPLVLRFQNVTDDCVRIYDTLERNHVELDRLKSIFQSIWQEQMYRIHVERDIFQSQVSEISNLRTEIKQLICTRQSIEMYISQLGTHADNDKISQFKNILCEISQLKEPQRFPKDRKFVKNNTAQYKIVSVKAASPTEYTRDYLREEAKPDLPPREEKEQHTLPETKSRSVLSQLMDKVRKTPATDGLKERSKSEDRVRECVELRDHSRQKVIHMAASENNTSRMKSRRVSSLYHSFGGYRNRSKSTTLGTETLSMRSERSNENCNYPERAQNEVPFLNYPEKTRIDTEPITECQWKEPITVKGNASQEIESEYQSINEAVSNVCESVSNNNCYSSDDEDDENTNYSRKTIRTSKKRVTAPSPRRIRRRRYPHSDTEESLFRSGSRRKSSTAVDGGSGSGGGGGGGTCIVVIDATKKGKFTEKQHSWETFPPKKKVIRNNVKPTFCYNPETFSSHFNVACIQDEKIKKSDSFEGHEEAVSSLVREFQKIRMKEKQQKQCIKKFSDE